MMDLTTQALLGAFDSQPNSTFEEDASKQQQTQSERGVCNSSCRGGAGIPELLDSLASLPGFFFGFLGISAPGCHTPWCWSRSVTTSGYCAASVTTTTEA